MEISLIKGQRHFQEISKMGKHGPEKDGQKICLFYVQELATYSLLLKPKCLRPKADGSSFAAYSNSRKKARTHLKPKIIKQGLFFFLKVKITHRFNFDSLKFLATAVSCNKCPNCRCIDFFPFSYFYLRFHGSRTLCKQQFSADGRRLLLCAVPCISRVRCAAAARSLPFLRV